MFPLTTLLVAVSAIVAASPHPHENTPTNYPTRLLAGVTVPDTPLITKSIAFARQNSDNFTFNHVMRSWLFGEIVAASDPIYKFRDREAVVSLASFQSSLPHQKLTSLRQ
jgi:hypothetical protein